MQHTPPFCLGAWYVEPDTYRIDGPEGTVHVEPKAMAVLCRLAGASGALVTREALMQDVWAGTVVVEETLTRCVSELRKVFGDDPRAPRVIATVRGKGYRLLLPVRPAPNEPPRQAHAMPSRIPRRAWGAAAALLALLALAWLARWPERETLLPSPPPRPTPLTTTPGAEFAARVSPDGAEVVYVGISPEGNPDLYLLRLGEAAPVRLTDAPGAEVAPAWTAGGQRIVFMQPGADGACTLLEIAPSGGQALPVGSCAGNTFQDLDASPDGRWLAFSIGPEAGAPARIVLLDRTTGARRLLTNPPASAWGDHTPVFAPDGQRLAFTRVAGEQAQALYVVALDAPGRAWPVTEGSRELLGHDWTPDGAHLVYASNRSGRFGLWMSAVPTEPLLFQTYLGRRAPLPEPRWIETGLTDARQPSLGRTGSRVVFGQDQSDTNLWVAPLDAPGPPRRLIASTRADEQAHRSPDGRRLAFVSERTGHPEIWVAGADGRHAAPLTRFEGAVLEAPRWSPDGRSLAFSARPDGHSDVYVLDVETRHLRRLTTASTDEGLPRWSRGGQRLYVASNRGGTWNVWALPASGGDMTPVTTTGGLVAEEHPDGRGFFFTRPDTAGLWWLPEPGATPRRWAEAPGALDAANWAIGRRGAYVLRREQAAAGGRVVVDRVSAATRRVEQAVAVLAEASAWAVPWSQPSFALAPDESSIVFTRTEGQGSDLWMLSLPLPQGSPAHD